MIRSFDELLVRVKSAPTKRVVVAGAAQLPVLEALKMATGEDLVDPILVGPEASTRDLAETIDFDLAPFRLVDASSEDSACSARAVAEVAASRAGLLMKGSVSTAKLLKAVLDRELGLRTDRVLSHAAVVEVAGYPKLMLHTDGGINIVQDLSVRKDILANALELARCLHIDQPFVAGLALVETENPKLPETQEMAELMHWVAGGKLGNLIFEGPIAIDMALSRRAAELKGIPSRVSGQTDIFLGPNISAVNFVVKSLIQMAQAKVAGVVVGARVPIVLLSRADTPEIRSLSMALATLYDEQEIEARKHRPYFG